MNWKTSLAIAVTALIFFSASFTLRYLSFSQTSFANGWDGYFYINQIQSWTEEGRMDVADVSLIYPLMRSIQFFTNDYVLSYKILAAILAGGFTVSLFLLTLQWTKNDRVGWLLASISLFSPHLTYFAAQYPKNLLGVIFFIWLLNVADSKNKLVPILLLVLNFFGHRVTFVLGFLFLLMRLTKSGRYVILLFVILLVAGFFLPGLLNFFDLERFMGVFSGRPQLAPYSFVSSFGLNLLSVEWLAEIILCCVVFFVAIIIALRRYDVSLTAILVILSFLIFPFFEWSNDGPAIRFFLIFILLCPILLIFLLKSVDIKYFFESLSLILIACSLFSFKSYDPNQHDPPYKLYDIISTKIISNVQRDSIELIIAHKALAEYIVYSTGIDAMSWRPEYPVKDTRLWRIAEGVKDVQFKFYLDSTDLKFVDRLTPSYSFIREDYWQKFLEHVKKDGNGELLRELSNWKNPDKTRPGFLMKQKR